MEDLKEIQEILSAKLIEWYEAMVGHLPNMVAALLILIAFWIISIILYKAAHSTIQKATQNTAITTLTASTIKIIIIATGLFFALGILGLQKTITSLLAGAGIVGLAIGFAFQDMATNLLAGFYMGIRQPFKQGDLIETEGFSGTVTAMSLRNTTIQDFNGQFVLIPNAQIFENPIINYSMTDARRIDVPFGIAYEDEIGTAQESVRKAAEKTDFISVDEATPVEVLARSFGPSSIDLELRFWIKTDASISYPQAQSQGVLIVKKALDKAGITIPYPIRTLAFDHATKANPAFKLLDYRAKGEESQSQASNAS